ncbi:hypothetical protein AB0H12_12150 [Actinosynnema sp. NPDC023794]
MSGIEPDYWAAAATVAPVLAAALVFEAKSTLANIKDSTTLIVVLFVTHGLILAGLGFTINFCFKALRGVSPAPYWTYVTEASIANAVAILILAPALVFVVNAMRLSLSSGKVQLYKLRFMLARTRNKRSHKKLVEVMNMLDAQRKTLRQLIREHESKDPAKLEPLIEALSDLDERFRNFKHLYDTYPPVQGNEESDSKDGDTLER